MAIDRAKEERIARWLESKNALGDCPSCGEFNWELHSDFVAPPAIRGSELHPNDVFPMIVLHCGNCARVLLFSAVVVGVA